MAVVVIRNVRVVCWEETRSDLMVDQRRLELLEVSMMHSTLAAASDLSINLFADEHAV